MEERGEENKIEREHNIISNNVYDDHVVRSEQFGEDYHNGRSSSEENEVKMEHSEEPIDERNARNKHEVYNDSAYGKHAAGSEQSDENSHDERSSGEENEVEMEHSKKKSNERNVRNEHEVGNDSTYRENVSESEQSDEDSYEERTS